MRRYDAVYNFYRVEFERGGWPIRFVEAGPDPIISVDRRQKPNLGQSARRERECEITCEIFATQWGRGEGAFQSSILGGPSGARCKPAWALSPSLSRFAEDRLLKAYIDRRVGWRGRVKKQHLVLALNRGRVEATLLSHHHCHHACLRPLRAARSGGPGPVPTGAHPPMP